MHSALPACKSQHANSHRAPESKNKRWKTEREREREVEGALPSLHLLCSFKTSSESSKRVCENN